MKYPMLCIPRGMLFHKPEYVEKSLNIAMESKRGGAQFVKSVECKPTKDKDGKEFNVFFITPNQEFPENAATALVYSKLTVDGIVNISTGSKGYFWKVKLYIPNLKSKHVKPVEKTNGPRIMTDEDTEAFRLWREKRAAAKATKVAKAKTGVWEQGEEEGEIKVVNESYDE